MIKNLLERSIMCINMRSFYASCMAVLVNVDVMETPIVMVGSVGMRCSTLALLQR